jgi:PEGA domain-containing protein
MFQLLLRFMLAVCVASIAVWPLSAQAGPAAAGAAEESTRLVDEGIQLRQQGQDAAALALLQRAVILAPDSVRARIHLATCFQALGDWVAADTHLREALRHPTDLYLERHLDAVAAAQRVIAERIGMLEVGGGPAGASVFLNGQRVGQLPFEQPIRARVGDYLLEVKMPDHYPTSRPVTIRSGTLVRESVQLVAAGVHVPEVLPAALDDAGASPLPTPAQASRSSASKSKWLVWTFGGASAAAAVTTVSALIVRNANATRWNDDTRCLNQPGMTRQQLCEGERHTAALAEDVALISGGAAVLLGAGALVIGLLDAHGPERDPSHMSWLAACALGPEGASCHGSF